MAKKSTKTSEIQRPWLKSYPDIIPHEIDKLEHASVADLLEESCRKFSSRPAFSCMGKTMTYGEVLAHSDRVGAWLQGRGLVKGDRVAIMMPNILQYPVVLLGILRAGLTVVNVNPLYTPRELKHQLSDSGAKALFVLENFACTYQEVADSVPIEHVVVTKMGDMLGGLKGTVVNVVVKHVKKLVPEWSISDHVSMKSVLGSGGKPFTTTQTGHDDICFLQYTGGTTGVSKGAVLTNRNILSNAAQNDLWLNVLNSGKGLPDQALYICALPLYHIFALTVNAIMGMNVGAHNVLIPNPRDIPGFVKELGNWKFHVFPGLNTLFNGLLNNEDFRKLDFSELLLSLGGGMAVQRPVAERWKDVTGCNISEGYGLSETSPVATANLFNLTEFSGTIGLPLPSTDIIIRDDDGKDLPLGEVGEICIRGPQVMAGYWQRDDETANVMTDDDFFKSGDMGFMNEAGQTTIVDRKKDMILVSGFNVYPNEIEEVAASHDGILESAAIAIPDDHSGEAVKLFVVKSDKDLTEQDVRDWCAKNLTNYKRPKQIEFRDELPKTNVGKILRRELRDE
ncbi:MAG: long-chain fatty acid--CoA ligase [Hyphomicrobiales bacterium]|nr:MAG: long-chain fatty acid--CoA ligase [Hyphomicrobiales bacterium]